jgi:hypothetical protein
MSNDGNWYPFSQKERQPYTLGAVLPFVNGDKIALIFAFTHQFHYPGTGDHQYYLGEYFPLGLRRFCLLRNIRMDEDLKSPDSGNFKVTLDPKVASYLTVDGKVPFVPVGHWVSVPRAPQRSFHTSLIENVPLSSPSITFPLHVASPAVVQAGGPSSSCEASSAFTSNFDSNGTNCKWNK